MRRIKTRDLDGMASVVATYCHARVWALRTAAVLLVGFAVGCGSGFSEILFHAVSAAGRSALDVALTDLANDLAAAAEQQEPDLSDDDGDGDGGADDADDDSDAGDIPPDDATRGDDTGDGVGDEGAGETVYLDNGCGSCHCADASGGCALSAPGLAGVPAADVASRLNGESPHPVQADLTATELADMAAFLASLEG